jgi:hypothetical protein
MFFHNIFNVITMAILICMVPVCPVRSEPSHRSEQTSQLLFGEMCELLERAEDFVKIKILYDNYEGWCQATQLEETAMEIAAVKTRLAAEWVNQITINDEIMNIPFGSSLAFIDGEKGNVEKYKIAYNGASLYPEKNTNNITFLKKCSFTFLNTPYLWGGRSVFGIDCSGFTQLVFKCINIQLLRDTYQQATQGATIESLEEVKCGDVAFFDNAAGKIVHVGIMLDGNTIIHASGKVRIDTIDPVGIINKDTGKRTHSLKIIKRVIY